MLGRRIAGRPVNYLDSAATSLRPRPVIEAMTRYHSDNGANIHRGKHALSEEASTAFEDARLKVAEFIGVRAGEVVFVRNTTEAINLVAGGLGLGPDDLVVTTLDAHHSNLLPWRARSRVRVVPVLPGGELDLDAYADALRAGPAVVALTACSNVTGVYQPVARLAELARQAGALVLVDAAQHVPHRGRIDAWGADFVAFSAHKMCGPTGVGVLCGKADSLERLTPMMYGGGTVDWVDAESVRLRKLPHRLEYGTPDIAAVLGLGAAVDYLDEIGAPALAGHDARMAAHLVAECRSRPRVSLLGDDPALDRAGLVSIALHGVARLDHVARALSDSYGVMCRSGHLCAQPLVSALAGDQVLRLSTYLYTEPEDVTAAFRAIDEILETL
ncbi:cysteine desulfurase [Actinoplanes sp. L3-i22]|nr:cysteine desulfurase [Actinoplanes sp. L3-i22]